MSPEKSSTYVDTIIDTAIKLNLPIGGALHFNRDIIDDVTNPEVLLHGNIYHAFGDKSRRWRSNILIFWGILQWFVIFLWHCRTAGLFIHRNTQIWTLFAHIQQISAWQKWVVKRYGCRIQKFSNVIVGDTQQFVSTFESLVNIFDNRYIRQSLTALKNIKPTKFIMPN